MAEKEKESGKPNKKIEERKFDDLRDVKGGTYDTDPGATKELPEGAKRERKGPLSSTKGRG